MGCSPRVHRELDTTEAIKTFTFTLVNTCHKIKTTMYREGRETASKKFDPGG